MTQPDRPAILVVDDNPDNVDIIREYLEVRGYPITVAHDGDEALTLLRQQPPDVMVLDVMMPKVDGWSVLMQLKADTDPAIRKLACLFRQVCHPDQIIVRWQRFHGSRRGVRTGRMS